jgi:hypothetical protein
VTEQSRGRWSGSAACGPNQPRRDARATRAEMKTGLGPRVGARPALGDRGTSLGPQPAGARARVSRQEAERGR